MLRMNRFLVILFFFTLRSSYGNLNIRRQMVENNVRRNSFTLESFFFQPFDEAKPDNKEIIRAKPIMNHEPILHNRGQTYGLEKFNVNAYDFNNLKQPIIINAEFHSRKIPGATKQEIKRPIINETTSKINTDLEMFSRTSLPTNVTEKTKKRIILRKRRKRPSNSTYGERENNFTENKAINANKISVIHPDPKVTVTSEISSQNSIQNKKSFETLVQPGNKKEFITETQRITETTEHPIDSKTTKIMNQLPSMNLKTFLKQQTEILSLSELLQTRNLSLADLLKGNRDASEILKSQQSVTVPSVNVRRKVYYKGESTTESFQRLDNISEQIKKEKLAELTAFRPNNNRYHQKISKIAPDGQLSQRQENYKKEKNNFEKNSTTRKTSFDHRSRVNEFRIKLRNFQRRTQTPALPMAITQSPTLNKETIMSSLPPLTFTAINSTEFPSRHKIFLKNTSNSEKFLTTTEIVPEGKNTNPIRVSSFIKRLPSLKKFVKEKIGSSENLIKKTEKVSTLENKNNTKESSEKNIVETENLTTTESSNKLNLNSEETQRPEFEEKDDLFELLKSEQNASKLQKILHSRNMTLQEILENRERPTVQSNIAELFANHQKEVSYRTESNQAFNDDVFPDFIKISKKLGKELSFKTTDFKEPLAEETVAETVKIQFPTLRKSKQFDNFISDEKEELRLNLQPNDLTEEKSKIEISAVWNLSESPHLQESSFTFKDIIPPENVTGLENSSEQIIKLGENNLKKLNSNRKFKQDINGKSFSDKPAAEDVGKAYIAPVVKSAILVSGVVMGITLFVFIAIFAACGWKQRQIRLKNSSIFGNTLNKQDNKSKCNNTISPDSFKEKKLKNTTDLEEDNSDSGSSTTESYLWSTLKNTFKNRSNTLKNRLAKEDKTKGDKMALGRFENKRVIESMSNDRFNSFHLQKNCFQTKKIDRNRNVISTSFNFRRSLSPNDIEGFSECPHGF